MINLIPPAAKKSITREYWVRVITVWSVLCAFAFGCVSFVFIPAYVLISSQVDAYAESATTASQKIATYENVTTGLIQASQEAKTVITTTNQIAVSEYVGLIESAQNANVSVTAITLKRTAEGGGFAPIQVSGIAGERQSLAQFRDTLLTKPQFTAVDLPIANLAKDRDIPFSITITVASTTPS